MPKWDFYHRRRNVLSCIQILWKLRIVDSRRSRNDIPWLCQFSTVNLLKRPDDLALRAIDGLAKFAWLFYIKATVPYQLNPPFTHHTHSQDTLESSLLGDNLSWILSPRISPLHAGIGQTNSLTDAGTCFKHGEWKAWHSYPDVSSKKSSSPQTSPTLYLYQSLYDTTPHSSRNSFARFKASVPTYTLLYRTQCLITTRLTQSPRSLPTLRSFVPSLSLDHLYCSGVIPSFLVTPSFRESCPRCNFSIIIHAWSIWRHKLEESWLLTSAWVSHRPKKGNIIEI